MTANSCNSAMPRAVITDALQLARQLCALHEAAQATAARTVKALETALEATVQQGVAALPEPTAPASDHRRRHRSGTPARIDNDPELAAFIRARIDRMTFNEVASAVAAYFPPERHVQRSAIHAWWHRTRRNT